MENKIPIIVVAGPTASGKTAFAAKLAYEIDGEVVSADSMQIYKGMSIATAKPTPEETLGVPHHMIDFLEPDCRYSVADFVNDASKIIADIHARGKMPVVCGGTGLYIDSLVNNISFIEFKSDPKLRSDLKELAQNQGVSEVWNMLYEIDPDYANSLHPNNLGRVIRAIEVYKATGITMTEHNENSRKAPSPYQAEMFGLYYENRNVLYDRINLRVDKMIENGLVEEAREFYKKYNPSTAAQAIGYKELIPFFENSADLNECVENIKKSTRHYAKRQLTWFRRNPKIKWISCEQDGECKKIINNISKSLFK